RLRTRDRRIDLAPAPFVADLARLREHLDEASAAAATNGAGSGHGALRLIGRRQVQSNNSWMHNVPRLMRGKDRCTLLMHPTDAASRGLDSGAVVEIVSRTGRVRAPLEVSDEMKPGVVSLPHGWGHHRAGTRMATAAATPGASLNDVTDEERVDALSGNAALSGVPVTVAAAPAAAG